jgi:hypothetical protein
VWISAAGAVPVTVNFAAQSAGGAVGDPEGGELAVGAWVWVGRFDLPPDEVRAAGRDHFVLAEHFELLCRSPGATRRWFRRPSGDGQSGALPDSFRRVRSRRRRPQRADRMGDRERVRRTRPAAGHRPPLKSLNR